MAGMKHSSIGRTMAALKRGKEKALSLDTLEGCSNVQAEHQ